MGVVLVDKSGSMNTSFSDDDINGAFLFNSANNKIKAAKKAIGSILKQLTPKDRLGIVTFNNNAEIMQKMEFVNDINMDKLNENIQNMAANKGTDFEKGYLLSMEVYKRLFEDNEYRLNSL